MEFVPLTDEKRIRLAYNAMAANLKEGATRLRRQVGYKGGGGTYNVFWRPAEQFWSLFETAVTANRYWCCFGTADPRKHLGLGITCEINPPFEGINRRCAGVFCRHENKDVFIAHSMRIGGGRKGIGRSAFMRTIRRRSRIVPIRWPDGLETDVLILGRLNHPTLPKRIGAFVHEVQRFKEAISRRA